VQHQIHRNTGAVGVSELLAASYLVVKPITNTLAAEFMLNWLDPSESEAISLARELQAGVLLMDDMRGRHNAMQSGITVVGKPSVLIPLCE
jgi:predicted nucleic acid-binding protein